MKVLNPLRSGIVLSGQDCLHCLLRHDHFPPFITLSRGSA